MSRLRVLMMVSLEIVFLYGSASKAFAQTIIDIPQKLPPGSGPILITSPTTYKKMQILKFAATVSVDPDHASHSVTFTIKDVTGLAPFPTLGPITLTPGPTSTSTSYCFPSLSSPPCASIATDIITIITPATGDNRYQIVFNLLANSDSNCVSTQNNQTDKFEIDATFNDPSISTPPLIGICLESFDTVQRPTTTIVSCFATNVTSIPPGECADTTPAKCVASVEGLPIQGCASQRPGVDVMLVLDKSGSMSSTTTMGGPTRMDALHTAVTNFVNVWGSLTPATTGSADKIGAVVFDTTSPTQPPIPLLPFPLTDVTVSANRNSVINAVDGVMPGGWTSIGAGLNQANNLFVSDGNRKVVLLMSDGQQNTEPLVKGDGGLYCNNAMVCTTQNPPIPQTCTAMNSCQLSSHPQLYTVTVGPSASVDPAIAQAIATGFYLNTETNYPLLSPFFLELLQNFLRFNSYETVRIISEPTPYSATIPISTTSRNAAFSVMWPSQALLRLTITPPGGAKPIVSESASGFISVVQPLPMPAPFDPMEDWKIEVEAVNPDMAAAAVARTPGGVPFDLHVITDDAGIKTDLAIVPGDYKPGDKIRLRAKLTQFGLPILGLGAHRKGDKIEAKLILPGKSIGDILSESKASADTSCPSPGTCDPQTPAEAKLDNTLKIVPSPLVPVPDKVTLYDDGRPEHGDDVAGDGIYNALYEATLPGHYNFTLAAESVAKDSVRFSRQQLRTVYVRPYPDPGNFDFQSSVSSAGGKAKTLSIVMTPRTKAGDHMGPGWKNYFWFTAAGQPPFKAKDNLDGTYTATLTFIGSKPPKVAVGFEDALAVIGDSVTFDNLPAKPTTLFDHIPEPKKLAVFFDTGAGIPHGTFGNAFDPGFSLNAGVEYILTSRFSAEGIFGYHHFPGRIAGDLNLYQFSANAKAYLTAGGTIRPFVNGGIGGYKFSPGSTNFGGNVGAGLLYVLTPHWGLQGSYNFHAVNTPVAATKFSTLQGGIRLVF